MKPLFSLPVRDVERADQQRTWPIPPEWLDSALADTEAQSAGKPGTLSVYVKKSGREVLVKGTAHADVTMPCARTLEPVPVALDAEILLLLTPKANAPGSVGGRPRRRERAREADGSEELDAELLSIEDAARDEYDGETVALDAFVREHLLLELPLFPVRSDLPFDPTPATDTPPDESGAAVDPRLAPLAALARQMQRTDKE